MGGMGPQTLWRCERTLLGHTNAAAVIALATWDGRAVPVSGSNDWTIRVWAVATGRLEAVLCQHTDSVAALAVHADRLYSASRDGTPIRMWRAGTPAWDLLRTVEAYAGGLDAVRRRCAGGSS